MIIGLYIGLAIVGILALVRGRVQISKTKVVVGVPARLLGLLGLTPFPLALLGGMIYLAANVDVTNPAAIQQFTQDHQGTFTLIEGVCVGIVAISFFVIAAILAVPPEEAERRARRRRRQGDYDDYEPENRPRRRRPSADIDDDDRPRRRPSRDELDDDDRPRRKRDDLDDRAR